MAAPEVDAIFSDVFGPVVDWYSGGVRDGEKLGTAKDLDVDCAVFAVVWRTK